MFFDSIRFLVFGVCVCVSGWVHGLSQHMMEHGGKGVCYEAHGDHHIKHR